MCVHVLDHMSSRSVSLTQITKCTVLIFLVFEDLVSITCKLQPVSVEHLYITVNARDLA